MIHDPLAPAFPSVSLWTSPEYRRASLRSERVRTALAIAVVAALVAFVVVRDLLAGQASGASHAWVGRSGLVVGALVLLFEAGVLLLVRQAIRSDRNLPGWLPPMSVLVECLVPTAIIVSLTSDPAVGPYRALLFPTILLYGIFIVLSTLRLRPGLCWGAGAISAGGYLLAVGLTSRQFPELADQESAGLAVYSTVAAALMATAWVAAAVAGQLRNGVALLLRLAEERRRIENRARDTLIFGLAKIAEHRDTDTGAHLARIADYSAALAAALRDAMPEIDEAWIERLRVASSLHDIGKVGLPDDVLKKPGPLTPEERLVMQSHPSLGAGTISAITAREEGETDPLLAMSEAIAAAHHERWDGTGYPNRRAASEIPLAARIVALADVYDALTSKRVYKPPMSHDKATQLIVEGRGTQFDPQIVDAFLATAERFDRARARFMDEAAP
ncbi:MAG: HD domain-containing protein [Phycisphaerales bacterium]|nr:HD domain-containing protein [Phycisphaerales bacterium]